MPDPLLHAQGLCRSLAGRPLWGPLSFAVQAGEALAISGPSGSGKGLLLRALAGLDPLQSGEVLLRGRPLAAWGAAHYRARLMYLPQRVPLYPGSAEDNLRLPFQLRAQAGQRFDPARARDLLAALGRGPAFLGQEARLLSGGEAQALALVRALLLSPDLLLLDEATSALDPEAAARAEALLDGWRREGERASLLVSHDPAQRVRLATRTLDLTAPLQGGGQVGP